MRWWGRKDSESDQDDKLPSSTGRRRDPLVEAVVQRFNLEAAAVLARRKWQPKELDERIGWSIVTGAFHELANYGEAAVAAIKRSSSHHQWTTAVLEALERIGGESALRTLGLGVRMRWRRGQWDAYCEHSLRCPAVQQAMAEELMDCFDPQVSRMLLAAGWSPSSTDQSVALAIAQGDPDGVAFFGPAAIPSLQRALTHASDPYPLLNALASIGTPESCTVLLEVLQEQWRQNVSRWSDFELVTKCRGGAIRPLIRLTGTDPARTSVVVEMLAAILSAPEAVSVEDLAAVATMPDPRHVYSVPEDPRPHEHLIDCSALRACAAEELQRRSST